MDFTGISANGLTETELNKITDAIEHIADANAVAVKEGTDEWAYWMSVLADSGIIVAVDAGFISNIVRFGSVVCIFLKINKFMKQNRKYGMRMDLDNVQLQMWVLKRCNPSDASLTIVPNSTVESVLTKLLNKLFNKKRVYLGSAIDRRYQIETNNYGSFNWDSLMHAMEISDGFNLSLTQNMLVAGYTEQISKHRTGALWKLIELIN